MFLLLRQLFESFRRPDFWAFSSWLDLATKYRSSSLGAVWIVTPPLAYVFGIGLSYSFLFGHDHMRFMGHLAGGYALWRLITQTITGASEAMQSHRAFIMDGRTRYTDYVLRVFAKALFHFVFAFVIFFGLALLLPGASIMGCLSLLVTLPVFFLNVLWIAMLTALLGVRFRDMHELSSTIFIFGFLLTPIIWDAAMVPADTTRGVVARLNPAFHLIEFVRAPVLGDVLEITTLIYVAIMTLVGWLATSLVYTRYYRYIPVWL